MAKVIVSVAPVTLELDPDLERALSPKEVAEDVIRCTEAGASVVHLHVRDGMGEPTEDIEKFSETTALIREKSDIIIQGSTGGYSHLSVEERCVSLNDSWVEMGSLNMGSVNFGDEVYINSLQDIKYWTNKMNNSGIMPELEVFDVAMLYTALEMEKEGLFKTRLNFGFALGFEWALPAKVTALKYLCDLVPDGAGWGLIHHGMTDYDLLASAIAMGAEFVRVGFEDSKFYPTNQKARNNTILVENVVEFITRMGHEIATPEEARLMMGMQKRA